MENCQGTTPWRAVLHATDSEYQGWAVSLGVPVAATDEMSRSVADGRNLPENETRQQRVPRRNRPTDRHTNTGKDAATN